MRFEREPYQDLMHDFLVERRRAGAFAGIGLGKTATTFSACRTSLGEGDFKAALVVATMRVANLTWPNELKKWDQFRSFTYEHLRHNGDRPTGRSQFYFTNYERLPKLGDLSFCSHVIFDELTKAKGHKSERINHLRPLLTNQVRWGLTGTPRPNSLLDLYAQIRLLDDGKRLSPSFTAFCECYFEAKKPYEYKLRPKEGAAELIYQKIHDLVITLRSSDYLDIPDTVVEDIEVPLPKAAHSIYRQLEKDLLALLASGRVVTAVNAGVLVNKLLQVCSGTVYTQDDLSGRSASFIHDAKILALKKLLTDTGEPAIIACNFIHERESIVKAVPRAVDAHTFKGDIEDAWNSGRIQYLVTDPRGLGHGLNLQVGGRDTVWVSPCHSRELYDQLNGRTARKGQDSVPRVFRLACPGTIDDAVLESLRVRGDEQGEMMEVLNNFRLQGSVFS